MAEKRKAFRNASGKHKYRRSLFFRYFTVSILIVIVCFSILGGALLIFVGNYWEEEKARILKNNKQNQG